MTTDEVISPGDLPHAEAAAYLAEVASLSGQHIHCGASVAFDEDDIPF